MMGQLISPPTLPDSSLAVGTWSKVGGCPTLTPPQSTNPECMDVNTHTHTHSGEHSYSSPDQKNSEKKEQNERRGERLERFKTFSVSSSVCQKVCVKVCRSDPRTVTVKAIVHLKMKICHYLLILMSLIQTCLTFFFYHGTQKVNF